MRRSTVINHSNEKTPTYENSKRKRSLEETTGQTKSKKRRYHSPYQTLSSTAKKKSKSSSTTPKRKSTRPSYSIEPLKNITLPNWECISPNIDQILSNKHTQSGVYAHEVHLVQQELEALLSMSMLRENFLENLLHPTASNNAELIRSKILQHKEAEDVYTSKKLPVKLFPPLIPHSQHRQNHHSHILLDRQVTMAPVIGARVDKIWLDMNNYYRKISTNEISTIEKLLHFNEQLEEKIQRYENDYRTNLLSQVNIIEKFNEENVQDFFHLADANPLTRHYLDRTTIGRFQQKLYERVPHTSPVYKTPTSSPFYRKSVGNSFDTNSTLRTSPRLLRFNLKSMADTEQSSSSSSFKSQKKILHTSFDLSERVQFVRDYLSDQHPLPLEPIKSTRKRKPSTQSADVFQSKLSTLRTLLHECSTLTLSALTRARRQSHGEQIWQKLTHIEHELESFVEKFETIDMENNSTPSEKTLQTIEHLLKDWQKYEEELERSSFS